MTANTLKAFAPVGFGRLEEEKQKGHMLHEKHGPLKQNISLDANQIRTRCIVQANYINWNEMLPF